MPSPSGCPSDCRILSLAAHCYPVTGRFYLAINVGSLLACTLVVYIQDSISWTLGFAVPGGAMLLAILLFCE